ncbi:hypothetical protein JF540_25035 [Salipiger thiooxidans]|uniref:hypothetical protein n=1 Tax=Salipiger thiooxidans TaxID=282683 RepID=UPI001A8FD67B|nr:hypothetical protein [Salipiger thiooxidans]MBN8189953.1 hypothetical protein [Salipiger thiooxidans]
MLIRRGIDDRATVCRGSAYFHAHTHAGSAQKTLKLYEGHFLDLLNDLGKEQGLADITTSTGSRLSQPDTVGRRNRDAASKSRMKIEPDRIAVRSRLVSSLLQDICP